MDELKQKTRSTAVALSLDTLDQLPAGVGRPTYRRADLTPGIVHIGLGNFHRGHQAWYLHRLMQQGLALDWAIIGAGVRPGDARMRDSLLAQDCLTTLIELDPGDVLIFHSNTLHRSDQNRSPNRRWTLIVCYNAVSNDTITKVDDRYYVPLDKVDDGAILEAGLKFASGEDEHFASQAYVPEAKKAS